MVSGQHKGCGICTFYQQSVGRPRNDEISPVDVVDLSLL